MTGSESLFLHSGNFSAINKKFIFIAVSNCCTLTHGHHAEEEIVRREFPAHASVFVVGSGNGDHHLAEDTVRVRRFGRRRVLSVIGSSGAGGTSAHANATGIVRVWEDQMRRRSCVLSSCKWTNVFVYKTGDLTRVLTSVKHCFDDESALVHVYRSRDTQVNSN